MGTLKSLEIIYPIFWKNNKKDLLVKVSEDNIDFSSAQVEFDDSERPTRLRIDKDNFLHVRSSKNRKKGISYRYYKEQEDYEVIDLLITVCGVKVLRVRKNPMDGHKPFRKCHWIFNPHGFWVFGLFDALEDSAGTMN